VASYGLSGANLETIAEQSFEMASLRAKDERSTIVLTDVISLMENRKYELSRIKREREKELAIMRQREIELHSGHYGRKNPKAHVLEQDEEDEEE
jgi:hypothetical protein